MVSVNKIIVVNIFTPSPILKFDKHRNKSKGKKQLNNLYWFGILFIVQNFNLVLLTHKVEAARLQLNKSSKNSPEQSALAKCR